MTKLNALFLMDADVLPLVYGPAERQALTEIFNFPQLPFSADTFRAHAGKFDEVNAVFSGWGMPPLDESLLARLPACEIVFHAAGTVKSFTTSAAWTRGLRVVSAAEANAIPVTEYAFASIVFCLKHAWQRIFELRAGQNPKRFDSTMPGAFESTVGLLSLSRTGSRVAERLRALDVKVLAYDPLASMAKAAALNVQLCSLEEVFARADVVSCHMPLLPETAALLHEQLFLSMKPGASFVNTARGQVVREAEMISALQKRPDLYAVLDVVESEPISRDSPLLRMPNVVVTPHIAGSLGPECRRMGRMMIDEARRYLSGKALQGEVFEQQMAFTA